MSATRLDGSSRKSRSAGAAEEVGPAWLQSRRLKRAINQQSLIEAVFEAAERATISLTHLVSDLDRDRCEYAVASVLLEEVWVSSR